MKHNIRLPLLLAFCLLGFSVVTIAKTESPDGKSDRHEQKLDKVFERLGLEAGKEASVRQILEETSSERKALRNKHKDEKKALRDSLNEKLSTVLNEEELAKFKKIKQRKMKHLKQKREQKCNHQGND